MHAVCHWIIWVRYWVKAKADCATSTVFHVRRCSINLRQYFDHKQYWLGILIYQSTCILTNNNKLKINKNKYCLKVYKKKVLSKVFMQRVLLLFQTWDGLQMCRCQWVFANEEQPVQKLLMPQKVTFARSIRHPVHYKLHSHICTHLTLRKVTSCGW